MLCGVSILEVSVAGRPFPKLFRMESILLVSCKSKIHWKITVSYCQGAQAHLCMISVCGCFLPLTSALVSYLGLGAAASCEGAKTECHVLSDLVV